MELVLFALGFILVFVLCVAAVFGWRGIRVLAGLCLIGVMATAIGGGVKLYRDTHPHYNGTTAEEILRERLGEAYSKMTPGEKAFEEDLARADRPSMSTADERLRARLR